MGPNLEKRHTNKSTHDTYCETSIIFTELCASSDLCVLSAPKTPPVYLTILSTSDQICMIYWIWTLFEQTLMKWLDKQMVSVEPFISFTPSNHLCYLTSSENFKWSHQSHLCPSTFWEEFMLLSIWPPSYYYVLEACCLTLFRPFVHLGKQNKLVRSAQYYTVIDFDSF